MAYSNTLRSIEGSLERTSRAISKNWGVKVVFSGAQARTNGEVIFLPYNADDLADDKKQLVHGNLDHETLHVAEEKLAEASAKQTPMAVFRGIKNAAERGLFNVLEDIRIERKYSILFPGIGQNLDYCNQHATDSWRTQMAKGHKPSFWTLFGVMIIANKRGMAYDWVPAPVQAWLPILADELARVDTLSDHFEVAKLAKDIYKKVIETCEQLESPDADGEPESGDDDKLAAPPSAKKPEPKPGKETEPEPSEPEPSESELGDGEPESGDSGESEDSDGSAGGEQDDSEDEPADSGSDGDSEPSSGTGDDEESEGNGSGDGAGDSEEESEGDNGTNDSGGDSDSEAPSSGANDGEPSGTDSSPIDGDKPEPAKPSKRDLASYNPRTDKVESEDIVMDKIRDEINKAAKSDAIHNDRYIPHPECMALDEWFKPSVRDAAAASNQYVEDLLLVKDQINTLRARLLGALRVMSVSREVGDQARGQLDSAALHSLKTGNKRIHSERTQGLEIDVAVSVLIDLSGSMGSSATRGSKSQYARRIAIALSETFEQLKVPFEVIGFHNNSGRMPDISYGDERRSGLRHQCREPFDFLVIKEFNEPLRPARERFASISGYDDNADGEAVRAVGRRLAARSEKNKMLIVLSDGEPLASGCSGTALHKDLRDAITELTKAGVSVFGFGILTSDVKRFYNEETRSSNLVIKSLETMAPMIYTVIRDKFLAMAKQRR